MKTVLITITSDIPQSSKLYDQLISDIKTLILMMEPKNFGMRPDKYTAPSYHHDIDDLCE